MENTVQGTRVAAAMKEYVRLLDPTRHSTLANAGGSELIKGTDVVGYNYISQNNVENRRLQHPEWKVVGTEEFTGCGTRGIYFNSPDVKGRMRSMNLDSKSSMLSTTGLQVLSSGQASTIVASPIPCPIPLTILSSECSIIADSGKMRHGI